MRFFLTVSTSKLAFGSYLFLAFVIIPLLSPLRTIGVWDPTILRNILLPPLLLAMLIAYGPARVLTPRSILQVILILIFIQAMMRGISNGANPELLRNYLSHLFQIASAYIMFGIGWVSIGRIGYTFWKRFVILALSAALISTLVTLIELKEGTVLRYYTPAYGFIFIAAFGALYSYRISILAILGLIVSNKRGPIISVFLIFIQHILGVIWSRNRHSIRSLAQKFIIAVSALLIIFVSVISIMMWIGKLNNLDSPIERAINTTYTRFISIVEAIEAGQELDYVFSGRLREIEKTIDSLEGFDYIFGAGAGWVIEMGGDKRIQNIHFTPLSLSAVYGVPFAIFLYAFFIFLIIRGTFRKSASELTATERIAPLYLGGAIVHSLIAYSLFIDFLVFFFAGVLSRSLQNVVTYHAR